MLKNSPSIEIDWKDAEAVDNYYLSFKHWSGVVRMGDTKKRQVFEVIDNKVLFEGEWYLPFYGSESEKKFIKSSHVFGFCFKMYNAFWGKQMCKTTVNILVIDSELSNEDYNYYITKQKNYRRLIEKEIGVIDYLKSIRLNKLDANDLNLFKANLPLLIEVPYVSGSGKKTVRYGKESFGKIEVSHRNRRGYLDIDNGYYGQQPFGNDFYIILNCGTYFTNVLSAYTRCEGKEITFDNVMLDILSERIVKAWDYAIEQNYGLR